MTDLPEFTTHDDAIVLSDGWNALARSIPGAEWDAGTKKYVLPRHRLNFRSATITLKLLPHLGAAYPELIAEQEKSDEHMRPKDFATPMNLPINAPHVIDTMRSEGKDLYTEQRSDLGYLDAILGTYGSAYLGWERGCGKTMGAFALMESQGCERVLVVCANTAKQTVWADVARDLWHGAGPILVLPNEKKKREAMLDEVADTDDVLLIIHYEALPIVAKGTKAGRGWDRIGEWDMVVADESHRVKNAKAQASRALKKIPTRLKVALSGSIIENNLEELFSQLQWLFPERYRSKWRDWNLRYIEYAEGGYGKVAIGVRPEMLEELQEELGVFLVYRRGREFAERPPRTDQTLYVDLKPAQRKAYDELVDECVTRLEDGTLIAAEDGLPVLSKLRQVASGLDLLGDVKDSSKIDLVVDMVNDNPAPVIVFGWYKASLVALRDRLDEPVSFITGDVEFADRDVEVRRFNEGDTRILLGTIATIGESMNFQRASEAILLDRSWNPAKNVQAEDRVDRTGQENPVTITHVVARDTVDELRVQPVLQSKDALRRTILGG